MTRITHNHRLLPAVLNRFVVGGFFVLLFASGVAASDHADPIFNRQQEAGITDLFAFPAWEGIRMTAKKDKTGKQIRDEMGNIEYEYPPGAFDKDGKVKDANELVLIFCVRRSLTASPPFADLAKYTYTINIDLQSEIQFETEPANLARYGGTVKTPGLIASHATIEFVLNDDLGFKIIDFKGFKAKPTMYSVSVRDDPFIFPQFFGTNVIAFVARVPFSSLPTPSMKRDFVLWATSHHNGKQVDHVGRSQRTQLPRFDLLNTRPPNEHLSALHESNDNPDLLEDTLRNIISPPFALRPYDFQPDVMFYSRDRKPRYPNGRQLEDDVADLTCRQGDCQLFELSQSHPKFSKGPAGRPTMNDKEFSDTFPYLADPHPDTDPPKPPRGPISPSFSTRNWAILIAAGLIFLVLLIAPWLLYRRANRRLRLATEQLAALQGRLAATPTLASPPPLAPPKPTP
ncbi:MAG: DUF4331 domain-containing protein [Planctomycetes bacterium]|nr:DUF4331 domain-containing protein [Planctomycetota bacterium]